MRCRYAPRALLSHVRVRIINRPRNQSGVDCGGGPQVLDVKWVAGACGRRAILVKVQEDSEAEEEAPVQRSRTEFVSKSSASRQMAYATMRATTALASSAQM